MYGSYIIIMYNENMSDDCWERGVVLRGSRGAKWGIRAQQVAKLKQLQPNPSSMTLLQQEGHL